MKLAGAVTAQLPIAHTVPVAVALIATPSPSRLLDAKRQPAVSGSQVRLCVAFDDELSYTQRCPGAACGFVTDPGHSGVAGAPALR